MKRYTKIRTAVFLLTSIIAFLTLAIELMMVQTIFAQERVYRLNLSSIGAMPANGEGVATVNIELTDEMGKFRQAVSEYNVQLH